MDCLTPIYGLDLRKHVKRKNNLYHLMAGQKLARTVSLLETMDQTELNYT